MNLPKWELADRASILLVKRDKGLPVEEKYLNKCLDEVWAVVPSKLFDNLYAVNKAMFEMEEVISRVFDFRDFEMAGHLYYVLRGLTHKRTAAKHAISEHLKEGKEIKKYGNGY